MCLFHIINLYSSVSYLVSIDKWFVDYKALGLSTPTQNSWGNNIWNSLSTREQHIYHSYNTLPHNLSKCSLGILLQEVFSMAGTSPRDIRISQSNRLVVLKQIYILWVDIYSAYGDTHDVFFMDKWVKKGELRCEKCRMYKGLKGDMRQDWWYVLGQWKVY